MKRSNRSIFCTTRITPEEVELINSFAKRQGVTRSTFIREVVLSAIESKNKENPPVAA